MSELVIGAIGFVAGVVVAVLVPRVYAFAARAIAKTKDKIEESK